MLILLIHTYLGSLLWALVGKQQALGNTIRSATIFTKAPDAGLVGHGAVRGRRLVAIGATSLACYTAYKASRCHGFFFFPPCALSLSLLSLPVRRTPSYGVYVL